jgi:hypothetical protein
VVTPKPDDLASILDRHGWYRQEGTTEELHRLCEVVDRIKPRLSTYFDLTVDAHHVDDVSLNIDSIVFTIVPKGKMPKTKKEVRQPGDFSVNDIVVLLDPNKYNYQKKSTFKVISIKDTPKGEEATVYGGNYYNKGAKKDRRFAEGEYRTYPVEELKFLCGPI